MVSWVYKGETALKTRPRLTYLITGATIENMEAVRKLTREMRMNVKQIQDVLDNASTATDSVQCCLVSTQTFSTERPPRLSHSTWALSVSCVQAQCCFTSTETTRTISDRAPRMSTSTFTQHLSSECELCSSSVLLYIHRDHKDY